MPGTSKCTKVDFSNLRTCCQHSAIPFKKYAGSWMWGRRRKEMTHPALLTPRLRLMHLEQAGILSQGGPPTAYPAGPVMHRANSLISCALHMPELNVADAFLACKH